MIEDVKYVEDSGTPKPPELRWMLGAHKAPTPSPKHRELQPSPRGRGDWG